MKNSYKKGILIAFGELFLKSEGVKKLFVKKLVFNIKFFLKDFNAKINLFHDRIFIEIPKKETEALKTIKNVFGISWFSEAFLFENPSFEDFSDFIKKNYKKWIKEKETFALRIKNGLKTQSKEEIINKIAKSIKRKVKLENPDKEIFIETKEGRYFLYFNKIKGAGGLPSACGEKVLVLMSGGIDSPVASFLASKRGANNVWIHFHSFPLVSNKSIEKTREIAQKFLKYQTYLKVYFAPFQKAQLEIKSKIPAQYRVLVYRRLMFKIAEIIAKKENCFALLTGESLGQVSSQTLPNINIIEEAVKISVLRPVIGKDKEEIIEIAKKIDTYDISIKPQEDCCTLFVPKHSCAKGNIEEIKKLEKKINSKKIINEIMKEIKVERY